MLAFELRRARTQAGGTGQLIHQSGALEGASCRYSWGGV